MRHISADWLHELYTVFIRLTSYSQGRPRLGCTDWKRFPMFRSCANAQPIKNPGGAQAQDLRPPEGLVLAALQRSSPTGNFQKSLGVLPRPGVDFLRWLKAVSVHDHVRHAFANGETEPALLRLTETNFSRHLHYCGPRLLDAVELRVECQVSAVPRCSAVSGSGPIRYCAGNLGVSVPPRIAPDRAACQT